MVLAKTNIHEHRTRQTYESYTFQPLMGFCIHLIGSVFPRILMFPDTKSMRENKTNWFPEGPDITVFTHV